MKSIRTRQDVDEGLKSLLQTDQRLVRIAETTGEVPLRLEAPGFAGLARIIIGQQVSRASASAIHNRFVEAISPQTPDAFLLAGEPVWIEIGLSRAKQTTLSGISKAITSKTFDLEALLSLPAEEAIAEMVALKGIGPWTAEVYLLFCAGHPDIFPAGDLALQEAVRHAFNLDKRPTDKELRSIATTWSPHKGVAARLFWAYYAVIKDGREALPL